MVGPSSKLLQLARVLESSLDGWHEQPHVLFHVIGLHEESFELGHKELELMVHPSEVLTGFVAPDEWDVFGMGVFGKAHDMDGRRPPGRVRNVSLMARDGSVAHVMSTPSTEPLASSEHLPGRGSDLLARCLQLPTTPEPVDAATAVLAWVRDVQRSADERGHDLTYRQVTELLRTCEPFEDWGTARAAVATGGLQLVHCSADDAAWHDDGSFARLVGHELLFDADLIGIVIRPWVQASVPKKVARDLRNAVTRMRRSA